MTPSLHHEVVTFDAHGAPNDQYVELTALLLPAGVTPSDVEKALGDGVTWYTAPAAENGGTFVPGQPTQPARVHGALRLRPSPVPRWRTLVSGFGIALTEAERGDSEAAVILVSVPAPRTADQPERPAAGEPSPHLHVAFCFGTTSRSIPRTLSDNRFGLIAALNKHCAAGALGPWRDIPHPGHGRRGNRAPQVAGDPSEAVRKVTAQARSGYPHRLTAAPASAAPVTGLRLDIDTDHMRSVTVRTDDPLMRELDGGRTLRLATPIGTLSHLVALAEYLVMLRHRTDYQAQWDWIDHIVEISPGPEYERVFTDLVARIGSPQEPHIDLVLPDLDEPFTGGGRLMASFPHERKEPYRVLPQWPHLRAWLLRPSYPGDLERTIRSGRIRFAPEADLTAVDEVPVLELLQAELDVDERHYLLDDGSLYRVDPGYLAAVDAALAAVATSAFPFPDYQRTDEGTYLDHAPRNSGWRAAELDQSWIFLPGETKFEPCDLVTDDGTLVFAKLKGKSSHFSHLATQAVTAAAALRNVPEARAAYLDRVQEATAAHPNGAAIEVAARERMDRVARRVPDAMTVCLLVLGTWTGTPDVRNLPLLARNCLRSAVRDLNNLGCRVELALVGPPPARPPAPRRPTGRALPSAAAPDPNRSPAALGPTSGSTTVKASSSRRPENVSPGHRPSHVRVGSPLSLAVGPTSTMTRSSSAIRSHWS